MVLVDLISALFCLTARRRHRITPSTSRAVLLHLILFFEHIFLGRCLEFLGISFLFFCNPSNDWRRWLAFGKWYLGLAPTSGSAVVDGLLFSRFLMDMGLKQIYDGSLRAIIGKSSCDERFPEYPRWNGLITLIWRRAICNSSTSGGSESTCVLLFP